MGRRIDFEEGWAFMEKGITKLKRILEGVVPGEHFNSEECSLLYTTVYDMCNQTHPNCVIQPQQLYNKYRQTIETYITSTVLPSLRERHGELVLREIVKRWENHKVMVHWLSGFFRYLDWHHVPRNSLPPLKEVGLTCFRDLFGYQDISVRARDAVIDLVERAREGAEIDRVLFKTVLDIFVEVGWFDYCFKDYVPGRSSASGDHGLAAFFDNLKIQ